MDTPTNRSANDLTASGSPAIPRRTLANRRNHSQLIRLDLLDDPSKSPTNTANPIYQSPLASARLISSTISAGSPLVSAFANLRQSVTFDQAAGSSGGGDGLRSALAAAISQSNLNSPIPTGAQQSTTTNPPSPAVSRVVPSLSRFVSASSRPLQLPQPTITSPDAAPALALTSSNSPASPDIHHQSTATRPRFMSRLTVVVWLILNSICVFGIIVTAMNIFSSVKDPLSSTNSPKTVVLLGCYAAFGSGVIFISLNRILRVRRAILDIPKLRLPIGKLELAHCLYRHIHTHISRVLKIDLDPLPAETMKPGWGVASKVAEVKVSPGIGAFQPRHHVRLNSPRSVMADDHLSSAPVAPDNGYIHYKKSILNSFALIQSAVITDMSEHPPEPSGSTPLVTSSSAKSSFIVKDTMKQVYGQRLPHESIAEYLEKAAARYGVDMGVAELYSRIFSKARLSQHELTAEEYRDAMKCVVLILKRIKRS